MSRVMVLGGYGNAGAQIVDLLLAFTDVVIDVCGRDGNRAKAFVDTHPADARRRLRPVAVDATDIEAVAAAAAGCELVILATGTPEVSHATARAALQAHIDYLDLQVGGANLPGLLALAPQFQAARLCAVTQGGFHPGVPAAMVRHVAARVPDLRTAQVSSVIALDWSSLGPFADSTVAEMMMEFRNYSYEEYRDHRWQRAGRTNKVDFPAPFGRRTCAAMSLPEMHEVSEELPNLATAGFYVGGFNKVVDYAILPTVWLGMRIAPQHAGRPLGRLLEWGLTRFSSAPYGTVLQLDGGRRDEPARTLMRLRHEDGYTLTAAPVVATVRQLVNGTAHPPGVHLQSMLVATGAFFDDLGAMGITVEVMC